MNIGRITARAIIFKDNKLFVVRQKDFNSGKPTDFWCVPGGKLEEDESIEDCAAREIHEELGIAPKIGRLIYVQQYRNGENQDIEFFFHVTNSSDFDDLSLEKTSHGRKEIHVYGFRETATLNLLPDFLKSRDINKDIISDRTLFFSYL